MPATWFPTRERFYATSFGVFAGMVGYALGDASLAAFNQKPLGFALTLSIVSVITIVLLVVFYQDKPDIPVSYSQALKENHEVHMVK